MAKPLFDEDSTKELLDRAAGQTTDLTALVTEIGKAEAADRQAHREHCFKMTSLIVFAFLCIAGFYFFRDRADIVPRLIHEISPWGGAGALGWTAKTALNDHHKRKEKAAQKAPKTRKEPDGK